MPVSAPAVSACIIAFNQAAYIAQAVESALRQDTSFEYEVVVGDDCSTDATPAILAELERTHRPRLRVARRPANLGVNGNLAATLQECRGKYIALLEGDDYWIDPSKLQRQHDALEANPDCAICFHPVRVLRGGRMAEIVPKGIPARTTLVDVLGRGNYVPTPSVMFRNRVREGFPPWFCDLRIGDLPLNVMNARFGDLLMIRRPMAVYRVHSGGTFSSLPNSARTEEVVQMYARIDELLEGRYHRIIEGVRSYWRAVEHFERGDLAAARACARRRFATPPSTRQRFMAGLLAYAPPAYRAIRKLRPAPL
jgi:glycosyltransferase involved in cell wall biosynthesis